MKTKLFNALSLAVIMAMLVTSLALADNLKNDVVTDPASIMLVPGGSSYGVDFYIQPTSSDGDPQCNFDTSSESLTFTINVPSGVTANPSQLTFTKCHDGSVKNGQTVQFSAGASAVSGYISFAENSNTSGGSFNYANAVFYINVANPPPPSDTTPPVITPNIVGTLGNNGWYVSDVIVNWTVTDPESTPSYSCSSTTIDYDTDGVILSCFATSAGGSNSASVTIKRDVTPPTISGSASPTANSNGWNNTDVSVSYTCADGLSGVASCGPNATLSDEGSGQSVLGTAIDNAGNSASTTVGGINIDKTPPTITWIGGPENGASYYFGFVPEEPTIVIADGLSGPHMYYYEGSDNSVGTHTIKVIAYDKAGNSNTESRTYTVLAWTLYGFYQPVDMNGVWNTVKGGSTVPFKFEVFAGSLELTDTSVVKSFAATPVPCPVTGVVSDAIEFTTTGSTSLRYDWTAGQFINNWQTPKKPGACYVVTMTTQDGTTLSANFKLK